MTFEKIQNDLFYYDSTGKERVLYKTNIRSGDTQIICTQKIENRPSVSVINNKVYYIDGNALYSVTLEKPLSNPNKEGETKNNVSLLPGNYDGDFNIFYFKGKIYIQGASLYRLENGEIVDLRDDVTSINIYNNNLYYGNSHGNVYRIDDVDNNDLKILSKDEITNMQDNYVSILGETYFINSLQIYNDKLYFVLSGGQTMPGRIYYYDLKTKTMNAVNAIQATAIKYFSIYNDKIYCYGDIDADKNALFIMGKDTIKILYSNIAGFSISDNKIYCYSYDIKMFVEMSLSGKKQKKLNIP